MAQLRLRTLGQFDASLDGKPVQGFDSDKVRALLIYLVVEADRSHRREKLAGLLWPDYPERSARTSLRSALTNLRRVLGDPKAKKPYLLVTRQSLQFNLQSDYHLDLEAIQRLTEGTPEIANLEAALESYQGDFLEGFSLMDSIAFEEWALVTREGVRREISQALLQLAGYKQESGAYEEALRYAQRQIALDPYQEAAHQQVMWILALSGRRNEALEHYDSFRETLQTELGVEPIPQTQEMYRDLQAGEIPGQPASTVILRREERQVGECPYRGLAAFREADAPFFYGREEFTSKLVETLKEGKLAVVIVGASGSGKSSTVFAGLLPRLREAGGWLELTCRPGVRPFQTLAAALVPELEVELRETERLVETNRLAEALRDGELQLEDVATRILEKQAVADRMLLVVDQFEELYTLCADVEMRSNYLDTLLEAVGSGKPIYLLLTLRADFMGQALSHRPFAEALQEGARLLGPMERGELRTAIEKPAEKQGAGFEAGLVTRILEDVGAEPGNLPLLEFALTLLWEQLEAGWMTHAAYDEIGRVEGALARYAEETYADLDAREGEQTQRIFVQLVQPGQGTEDTRRVALRSELEEEQWGLVQRLADKRLVVTGQDEGGRETVEVVHEALIRGWGRLRSWMDADRGFRVWQEDLRAAQRGWEHSGMDEGGLLRGAPLVGAEEWLEERGEELSRGEKTFIEESINLRERERARRERRRRATVVWLASGLVVALVLALLAVVQWRRADEASGLAMERQGIAQAEAEARATAQTEAEALARMATARELAAASLANLSADPELSLLLALQAAEQTYALDGFVLAEAEDALHKAVQNLRVVETLPSGRGLDYSPDGSRLAASGSENDAYIYDLSSGEVSIRMYGHDDEIMNIAFSPDSRRVATTSMDSTAIIWDATTGEPLLTLKGHQAGTISPAFSPDGALLATTSLDGTARVWDTTSGEELLNLPHAGITAGVAFSPDGERLAVADHDAYAARIWDTSNGELLVSMEGHEEGLNDLAFSPDGERLATASSDVTAKVWDSATGELLMTLEAENGFVFGIDYSADGSFIATGVADGTATVWDANTGKQVLTLAGHSAGIGNVVFSPDSSHLATGASDAARIWDITPGGSREFLTLMGHSSVAFRLDYSPDGSRLASAGFDGLVTVWELPSGEEALALKGHTDLVYETRFDPAGERLASVSADGTAIVWDAVSGRALLTLEGGCGSLNGVAFSTDGDKLAAACEDGSVEVWDSHTGAPLLSIQAVVDGMFPDVFGVDFNPRGNSLASAGWDNLVGIWDSQSGEVLATLSGHSDRVNHVRFSPDGEFLATVGWDAIARVWDPVSGRELRNMSGHSGIIWSVAVSPDSSKLATASFDATTRVWEVASGREILTLASHGQPASGVAFSPDGRHLAASLSDGTVRIYILPVEELVATAQERLTRWFTPAECRQFLHLETCPPQP